MELGEDALPERLEGDLQSGTRVWDLELLENRGMQDADAAKFDIGTRAEGGLDAFLDCGEPRGFLGGWCGAVVDSCRTAREIGGICDDER